MALNSVQPSPQRAFDAGDGAAASAPGSSHTLLARVDGTPRHVRAVIIGSGFGGLCMAIKLKQAGIHDFVVLERSHTVGGTWRDNTYPGCECDVPSHLYSYSFEPETEWPKPFAEHQDIQAYIERVTQKYNLRQHIQFHANVQEARFDEARNIWQVQTSLGPISADLIMTATGGLSDPYTPELPGLQSFKGAQFHSARWDHSYDFAGKRVAVVGTGASTIQFLPRVAPQCQELTLFQRTPAWVLPKRNRPFGPLARLVLRTPLRALYRLLIFWSFENAGFLMRHPTLMNSLARPAGIRHIRKHIKDRALRKLVTPDYIPGCKRILLSDEYYPALARDNVKLTSSGIREVREHSIVTDDGVEHPVDVILFGTGFMTGNNPNQPDCIGRGGESLRDRFSHEPPQAYLGTMLHGFPNFFLMGGPNSGLGHNSIVYILEGAVAQIMKSLQLMQDHGARTLEVTKDASVQYNREVQDKLQDTVWNTGCNSYYRHTDGTNIAIWPGSAFSYQRATRTLNATHLQLSGKEESR